LAQFPDKKNAFTAALSTKPVDATSFMLAVALHLVTGARRWKNRDCSQLNRLAADLVPGLGLVGLPPAASLL
jgi:hypothetical protein